MSNLDKALNSFIQWARNLEFSAEIDSFASSLKAGLPTVLLIRDDTTVSLTGDDAERHAELLEGIREVLPNKEQISPGEVSALFDSSLMAIVKAVKTSPQAVDDALQRITTQLRADLLRPAQDWTVHLRVAGIAPSGLPTQFGGVSFEKSDEQGLQEILAPVKSAIARNPTYSVEARADLQKSIEGDAHSKLRGDAVAKVSVKALDYAAAKMAATRILQRTIDIVNFFVNAPRLNGWIFLPGQAAERVELAIATTNNEQFKINHFNPGPIRRIPLNQVVALPIALRAGALLVGESGPLADRILAGLQWAGRGQVEQRPEEAFLLFAIALESALLGRLNTPEIGLRLGLRAAHLFGGDLSQRQLVSRQIRRLYQIRSKIVHSGSFEVFSSDLDLIRDYARTALMIFLNEEPFKKFQSEQQLEDWFDQRLLGG